MPGLEKLEALTEEFSTIDDPGMRADLLIEYSEGYNEVPENLASRPFPENRRVPGCESDVFLFTTKDGEGFRFYFGIDNPQGISAMALASIISECLDGVPASELSQVDEGFVHTLFGKQLSMGKGQGLGNLLRMVKCPENWLVA